MLVSLLVVKPTFAQVSKFGNEQFIVDTVNVLAVIVDEKDFLRAKRFKIITKSQGAKVLDQVVEDYYNPTIRPKNFKARLIWMKTLKELGLE